MNVKKGQSVAVFDSQASFLNLHTPDLSITEALAKKCPGGNITGMETTLRKREFIFFQIYDLEARASCQDAVANK